MNATRSPLRLRRPRWLAGLLARLGFKPKSPRLDVIPGTLGAPAGPPQQLRHPVRLDARGLQRLVAAAYRIESRAEPAPQETRRRAAGS